MDAEKLDKHIDSIKEYLENMTSEPNMYTRSTKGFVGNKEPKCNLPYQS
jgi:hypothetical protein